MTLVTFFFSSRKRHTSSTRDWSSDVCPSDLDEGTPPPVRVARPLHYKHDLPGFLGEKRRQIFVADVDSGERRQLSSGLHDHMSRSEERRVGKECSPRWLS